MGGGNYLYIGKNSSLKNSVFYFFGPNNIVKISDNVHLRDATFWIEGTNNAIFIDEFTTSHGNIQFAACEGSVIHIGKDCMFSHDIYLRTTDSHPIFKHGERINKAKNINIGNHVWVGMQSLILKGANIPDGCIVGARTLVTESKFTPNSIIIGQPAKLVKNDIKWNRSLSE